MKLKCKIDTVIYFLDDGYIEIRLKTPRSSLQKVNKLNLRTQKNAVLVVGKPK